MKPRRGGRSSLNPNHHLKYKSEIRVYKSHIGRSNRERLLAYAALVRAKMHYLAVTGNSASNFEKDAARDSGITTRMIRYHLAWGEIDRKARDILMETDAGARDLTLVARAGSATRQRVAAKKYATRGRIYLEKWVYSALPPKLKPPVKGALASLLHVGDVLDVLRTLPDESVQSVITSPPYWGRVRDFELGADQLGFEANPDEYVDRLVPILREARRVLKEDGTLWINIGDAASSGETTGSGSTSARQAHLSINTGRRANPNRLKEKELVGVPWRLALALQKDGWHLRADVIWEQTQKMPESVKDRPSRGHEHIFLFTKKPHYYFDKSALQHALKEGEYGSRDVWAFSSDRRKGGRNHPTPFPVTLPALCIVAATKPGDVVLDPFMGSGTTALAALQAGRASVGVDANLKYIEDAAKRIAREGGKPEVKHVSPPRKGRLRPSPALRLVRPSIGAEKNVRPSGNAA